MNCHVSIIIPVYNVKRYLRQCLDSCLAQTMHEVQIICVDDGSTDSSPDILREYASTDVRVRIVTQKNGGQAAARNAALPHIRGKYLLFVDSDDWIHEETCQRTFQLAEKHDADLCIFRSVRPGKKVGKTKHGQNLHEDIRFLSDLTADEKCKKQLFCRDISPWCKLTRTDFLRQHEFTFPEGLVFEDVPFHWNVICEAKRILYIKDELYYYRQRAGSTVASRSKNRFDGITVYDIIKQNLEKSGCYEDCRQLFLNDKLAAFRSHYREIGPRFRQEMRQRILESLTDSEWNHIMNDPTMSKRHRKFYLELKSGSFSLHNLGWLAFADFWSFCENHILWPARKLREFHWFTKKTS